jgi:hypothetical protein
MRPLNNKNKILQDTQCIINKYTFDIFESYYYNKDISCIIVCDGVKEWQNRFISEIDKILKVPQGQGWFKMLHITDVTFDLISDFKIQLILIKLGKNFEEIKIHRKKYIEKYGEHATFPYIAFKIIKE